MGDVTSGSIEALQHDIEGDVCRPGDIGYDEAVSIWNGAITRRPAVVVRCHNSGDVAAALTFAQRQGLEVSAQRVPPQRQHRAGRLTSTVTT